MFKATIKAHSRFGAVTDAVEKIAIRAANAGAHAGGEEYERVASQRRRTGKMSDVHVIPAQGDVNGYTAGVRNDPKAWYERFQDEGTLASRTKALHKETHRRRATPSGQERFAKVSGRKGITPLKFKSKSRNVGRKEMEAEIRKG